MRVTHANETSRPGPTGPARLRRWFGWNRDVPTVAIQLDDDTASVLCLRRQAVITACGRVSLPPGTVRNGRLRVGGPATGALADLRRALQLPARCRAVALVQPHGAEVNGTTVVARVDGEETSARRQVIMAAGFATVQLEPVPAALARLGADRPGPVYLDGGGWRAYRDGDHLEVEPSDRSVAGVVIGPSPVERTNLDDAAPVAADPGVELLDGWPLLLGAALVHGGHRPGSLIESTDPAPVGAWTIERVAGHEGDLR